MRLHVLVVAGAVLGAIALMAQAPAPSAGRYEIAPDENGFVRLDTETGAMSHCVKRGDAWHCDVLAEDRTEADARLESLQRELETLTKTVDALAARVATLEAGRSGGSKDEPAAGAAPTDPEIDRALSFAERLMQRFFDMVREFKAEEQGQRI